MLSSAMRLAPCRWNCGCGPTSTTTYRSPFPLVPASPSPFTRRREPVSTPGGMVTESERVSCTLPSPRQLSHGVWTMVPVPPQRGQGCAIWKMPLEVTIEPEP